jgi:hypothetical protein
MTDADQHESLIAAHETRLRALLDGDLDTLRTVVGEDLIFIAPNGMTKTRPEVFAAAEAGTLRILRMDASGVSTRLYGDIGVLIYDADAKMIDGDTMIEGMTRSTTIYVYRDGGWQLVSQHQSRLE